MKHKLGLLSLAAIILAVLTAVSVCVGSYPLSLSQIGSLLCGGLPGTMEYRVFWNLRLPRVLMGLLSGGALGVAGGIYQTIFSNDLASPDLTGVASGASFGAALAIVLGAGSGIQIMTGSFAMGLVSLAFVLLLARASGMERTGSFILSGLIVSSLADAGIMMLKFLADPEQELAAIEFWTMGSLAAVTAKKILPQMLVIGVPLVVLLCCNRQATILSLGEETARSMGLSPKRWRMIFLSLSTLMVAGVVSVTGVIAFVGLIAPHIAFMIHRRRNRSYFIHCGIWGSNILLAADIFARTCSKGAEMPLSIFTVLLSVPVLTGLLIRKKGVGDGVRP